MGAVGGSGTAARQAAHATRGAAPLARRVRDQPAGGGRRHGAAAGRSARRGGVERDPAVGREPDLVPGVGVGVGDLEGAGVGVVAAGREAGGDPHRHAPHPQQQRHRSGELLAVAELGLEQERVERILGARRPLVVAEAVAGAQVGHHLADELQLVVRLRREPLRQRIRLAIRRSLHVLRRRRPGLGGEHGAIRGRMEARELDREPLAAARRDRHRQIAAQRLPRVRQRRRGAELSVGRLRGVDPRLIRDARPEQAIGGDRAGAQDAVAAARDPRLKRPLPGSDQIGRPHPLDRHPDRLGVPADGGG